MSFALLIIGITLIVAAVRDTQGTLVSLLYGDFTGSNNFLYWVAALLLIGAVGYVDRLKPVSDGLLVVIILVLLLKRGNPKAEAGGFFQQFLDAINTTTKPGAATSTAGAGTITLPSFTF